MTKMVKYLKRRDDGFVISHPGPDFPGHKDFDEIELPADENPQPKEFQAPEADPELVQVDAKGNVKGAKRQPAA
jgi:hypothetical protein